MEVSQDLNDFLNSVRFKTDYEFQIGRKKIEPLRREDLISAIVKNRSVIHVGCSDHIGKIEEKRRLGKWLHEIINDSASSCIGIDIDSESVNYIKNNLGIDNVVAGDITSDPFPEISDKRWDIILFGEIVEHLDNPVKFLSDIREKYSENIDEFVITVPSILNIARFRFMKSYKEVINTDHRYWFTPYTICKILVAAGYNPKQLDFVNLCRLSISERVIRKIKRLLGIGIKYPFMYYNTIIVQGKVK